MGSSRRFSYTKWDEYFIWVSFDVDYISSIKSHTSSDLFASCVKPGELGDKVGVDTLYVTTLNDYNEEYTAGDTVNNIVEIKEWISSVDDFQDFYSLSDYILSNEQGVRDEEFKLKLKEPPSKDEQFFALQITYILNNREVIHCTTAPINLLK